MTSEEKLKRLAAQPSFKQLKIFHENQVAVERAKVELIDQSMWDLFSWIFQKCWCIISTTITWSKSIQTRRCYLPIQILSRIKFKRLTYMTFKLIKSSLIFLGTRTWVHSTIWKQKSNRQNKGRVERGNYWRVCRFEGENVFIQNKERRNEEGKEWRRT